MTRPTCYRSGDEVKPGDTVKCPDGETGTVGVVFEWPAEPDRDHSTFPDFFVRRKDGSEIGYSASDPGLIFLSRAKRMTSATMGATIKKSEFLKLLKDLGSHSTYYPEPLARQLVACGLSAEVAAGGRGLVVEGHLIPLSDPEWGEPGISTLSILSTVYELATGEPPSSEMSGRGFWYRDVMNKLAKFWGFEGNYS